MSRAFAAIISLDSDYFVGVEFHTIDVDMAIVLLKDFGSLRYSDRELCEQGVSRTHVSREYPYGLHHDLPSSEWVEFVSS